MTKTLSLIKSIMLKYLNTFMRLLTVSPEYGSLPCSERLCALTKEHQTTWVKRQPSDINLWLLFFQHEAFGHTGAIKSHAMTFPLTFTWIAAVCFASSASTYLDERQSGASARTNLIGHASLNASRSNNIWRTTREMFPYETDEQMRRPCDFLSHLKRKNNNQVKWDHSAFSF